MKDQELLNRLWERFEQIASPEGKRLATTLRDFEEKGGVDLNYPCLAMAIGMGLVAVADQPGAGEFAQGIAKVIWVVPSLLVEILDTIRSPERLGKW